MVYADVFLGQILKEVDADNIAILSLHFSPSEKFILSIEPSTQIIPLGEVIHCCILMVIFEYKITHLHINSDQNKIIFIWINLVAQY